MQGYPEYPDSPPLANQPGPRPVRGMSRTLLLLFLMAGVFGGPYVVEEFEFAFARGKERAQAEVARAELGKLPPEGESVYRVVAKAIAPSVVGIVTAQTVQGEPDELSRLFGAPQFRAEGLGSGVIVDAEGYILTNNHVVEHASQIVVKLSDGREIDQVRVVGTDPAADIAVLKVSSANLVAAPWGDSDTLEVGDPVLAIGNPFGLAHTVTAGIVSAKNRHEIGGNTAYKDFLQTDAAVNPGNSGGPLVNMRGQVVGINVAIASTNGGYQGISFAIPSNLAKNQYEQLRATGKVARGWLGVEPGRLNEALAEKLGVKGTDGAVINHVVPHGPAAAAGIEPGDVVVQWNGKPIHDPAELVLAVGQSAIGSKASATILRKGNRVKITVTVADRPSQFH